MKWTRDIDLLEKLTIGFIVVAILAFCFILVLTILFGTSETHPYEMQCRIGFGKQQAFCKLLPLKVWRGL